MMTNRRAYLDHNATSPLRPQARAAMLAALETSGNASSVHHEGRRARSVIDEARDKVARLAGVTAGMVTFTSCGTEANNLIIRGTPSERLIVTSIEHVSVLDPASSSDLPVEIAPVTGDGVVDLDALRRLLAEGRGRALVSVMLANNETGAIQPVGDVVAIAREFDALVHTDAVQAAGKMTLSMIALGVDAITVSGHKLGGPQGTGAAITARDLALKPLISGGGQEFFRRAGTENVAGIAGFGAAAEAAAAGRSDFAARMGGLRDRLEAGLREIALEVRVFCDTVERLPNTTCFAHPGLSAEHLLMAFDLDGIAVSSGAACSSGKVRLSHVLAAMGVERKLAEGAIRVSLGWTTGEDEVERFLEVWRRIVARHRAHRAA